MLNQGNGIDYKKPHWAGTHWPPGQPALLSLFADRDVLARPGGPLAYLGAFDITQIQIVTALLAVLGVGLLVELGRRCFDLRTGLFAGALLALYPNAIGISHTLYAESNFLVLLIGALVLGTGTAVASTGRAALTGVAFGAAAYFRSLALPLVAPFALRALFRAPGGGVPRRGLAF